MDINSSDKIGLFLMGEKGFRVLETFVTQWKAERIAYVCIGKDKSLDQDYSEDILSLASQNGILTINRESNVPHSHFQLAISWRWLISSSEKLLIIHDSLLPKYRGFAPLVNMLIDGCDEIGASLIWASEEYDKGNIISQSSRPINHPIRIQSAIQLVSESYVELTSNLIKLIDGGSIPQGSPQNEEKATYSLWLDSGDYFIDWSLDASRIVRHILASGSPYGGARSIVDDETIIIHEAEEIPDYEISNRKPGKVLFMENDLPVIVCGFGLIRILKMTKDGMDFKLKKFRTRFK